MLSPALGRRASPSPTSCTRPGRSGSDWRVGRTCSTVAGSLSSSPAPDSRGAACTGRCSSGSAVRSFEGGTSCLTVGCALALFLASFSWRSRSRFSRFVSLWCFLGGAALGFGGGSGPKSDSSARAGLAAGRLSLRDGVSGAASGPKSSSLSGGGAGFARGAGRSGSALGFSSILSRRPGLPSRVRG